MNPDMTWSSMVEELLLRPKRTVNGRVFRRMPGWLVDFTTTPLVSVRVTAWQNALRELEWLMYGDGELQRLHPEARHWWDRWAIDGKVPGVGLPGVDALLEQVVLHPHSRRLIVTTWDKVRSVIPRNDFVAQVTVDEGRLDLFVYQRTCCMLRGVNHNWIQYWALAKWLAQSAGLAQGTLRWVSGDVHLYEQHENVAKRAAQAERPATPALQYTPTGGPFNAGGFSITREYLPVVRDAVEYV